MQNLPRGAPPPIRFQFSDYTFLTVSQDKISLNHYYSDFWCRYDVSNP